MMKLTDNLLMVILFIAVAPFLSGLISKVKNDLRMRRGQSVWQPYYNLFKLFAKDEVISSTASWIFRIAPLVLIASTLAAVYSLREFLTVVFIFALGRFFLALAALDTGSAFGGMGSSREMFISSLSEPAACLAGFALTLQFGSTDFIAWRGSFFVSAAAFIAAIALFMVLLAETSRLPVDNQETHLELTMVHEAMILEYSGRRLALIELAAQIKQLIWIFIIAQVVFPLAVPAGDSTLLIFWLLWFMVRIIIVAVAIAFLEVLVAKMRLFRVADFLGFAVILGALATVCAVLGY